MKGTDFVQDGGPKPTETSTTSELVVALLIPRRGEIEFRQGHHSLERDTLHLEIHGAFYRQW